MPVDLPPLPGETPSPAAPAAAEHAHSAAQRAGVATREVVDMAELRSASALFVAVWGTSPEGAPVHSEMMLELAHAGGCVTGAYEGADLVGAAVLGVARPAGSTYGFLAAAAPGRASGGVGRALKLRQRAWALQRGLTTMRWTFDPLVARNARFNLTRLGARATTYEFAFYGRMSDAVNGDDDADRFVAHWRLDSPHVASRAAGEATPERTPSADADVVADGPDGAPMALRDDVGLWCRVPTDVVELRRTDPAQASAWRAATREIFAPALAQGRAATHLGRDGWYLLEETS